MPRKKRRQPDDFNEEEFRGFLNTYLSEAFPNRQRIGCPPDSDLQRMAEFWMGHAHKDLTDQYAEQLREDVKYRREWCEKIGLGFVLPANLSQLSQPKRAAVASRKAA